MRGSAAGVLSGVLGKTRNLEGSTIPWTVNRLGSQWKSTLVNFDALAFIVNFARAEVGRAYIDTFYFDEATNVWWSIARALVAFD